MLKDRINEYFTLSPRRILQLCARDVCALLRAQDSASTLSGKDDITACSPFSHPIAIQPKEPADDSHAFTTYFEPKNYHAHPSPPKQQQYPASRIIPKSARDAVIDRQRLACGAWALLPAVQSTLAGLSQSVRPLRRLGCDELPSSNGPHTADHDA
jgi:hypothetical protein